MLFLEKGLTKRDPDKTKYFYFYKSIPVDVFSCIEIHQHRIFADRTSSLVVIMFFKDVYILLATC